MSFGLQQEGGSLIAPMALPHPLHPIDSRSRNRRWNLWVGWCVSSPDDLCTRPEALRYYIYIYVCIRYTSSVIGRIYIYVYIYNIYIYMHIYTYNRSVVQYKWSCTPSHSIGLCFFFLFFLLFFLFCFFWGVGCTISGSNATISFFLVYQLCLDLCLNTVLS